MARRKRLRRSSNDRQGELMTGRDLPRLLLTVTVSLSCGTPVASVPDPREVRFAGTAAVRVSPARSGEWLLLFETLQPQLLITSPIRSGGLLGAGPEIVRTYNAPEGWILIDAVAHPSGDVSLLNLRVDPTADYPLRAMISRFGSRRRNGFGSRSRGTAM